MVTFYISCWLYLIGYDSDVAREKSIDYNTKTYANPIRQGVGARPREQDYDEDGDDRSDLYVFFIHKYS